MQDARHSVTVTRAASPGSTANTGPIAASPFTPHPHRAESPPHAGKPRFGGLRCDPGNGCPHGGLGRDSSGDQRLGQEWC